MTDYMKQIRHTIGDMALEHYRGKTLKYAFLDTSEKRAMGILIESNKIEIEKFMRHLRRYGIDVLQNIKVPFREIRIPPIMQPYQKQIIEKIKSDDGTMKSICFTIPVPKLVFNFGEPTSYYYYLVIRKIEEIDIDR